MLQDWVLASESSNEVVVGVDESQEKAMKVTGRAHLRTKEDLQF